MYSHPQLETSAAPPDSVWSFLMNDKILILLFVTGHKSGHLCQFFCLIVGAILYLLSAASYRLWSALFIAKAR